MAADVDIVLIHGLICWRSAGFFFPLDLEADTTMCELNLTYSVTPFATAAEPKVDNVNTTAATSAKPKPDRAEEGLYPNILSSAETIISKWISHRPICNILGCSDITI